MNSGRTDVAHLVWRSFCHDRLVEIFSALIAGAFIGSVLGFVGAGGAMLSVPILVYFFGFAPQHASTAALAVVFAAAAAGVIPKLRVHHVLIREALTIWSLGLVTNVGGAWISHRLSDGALLTGFSLVLIGAGSSMLMRSIKGQEKRIPFAVLTLVSLAIGLMTGLFGIGGGFLAIPVLVLFFHTPQSKAVGTSLLIIAINSLTAFLAHQSIWHEINWNIPVAMAISAIAVTATASHHHARVSPTALRHAFAFLLFAVAGFTLIQTYFFA